MSAFYDRLSDTSRRLLAQYGKPMSLRRTTPGTYDPITGMRTGDTVSDIAVTGITTSIGTQYAATHQVEAGDRKAIIDGSVKPLLTDKIVDGDQVMQIVAIDAVEPASTPLLYTMQVRR